MSKSKTKIMLICFFDIGDIIQFEFAPEETNVNDILRADFEKDYCCREVQARRVVERLLVDSSPRQGVGTFASSVDVFSRKRHLRHGSSAILS
jgi:hypothetical protein